MSLIAYSSNVLLLAASVAWMRCRGLRIACCAWHVARQRLVVPHAVGACAVVQRCWSTLPSLPATATLSVRCDHAQCAYIAPARCTGRHVARRARPRVRHVAERTKPQTDGALVQRTARRVNAKRRGHPDAADSGQRAIACHLTRGGGGRAVEGERDTSHPAGASAHGASCTMHRGRSSRAAGHRLRGPSSCGPARLRNEE